MIIGFNVPIVITPTGGVGEQCQKVTCGVETDLLTQCDPALAFPSGSETVCKLASEWLILLPADQLTRVMSQPLHCRCAVL